MKKRAIISLVLLVSMSFQTTAPLFERVKQKVVSVKEAMSQAKAVLRDNWQCFKSGTGPNCTKEQRNALSIIQDFVSGKWKSAKAKLKKWGNPCDLEGKCGMAIFAIVAIIVAIFFYGGLTAMELELRWAKTLPTAPDLKKDLRVEKPLFKPLTVPYERRGRLDWERIKRLIQSLQVTERNQSIAWMQQVLSGEVYSPLSLRESPQSSGYANVLGEAGWNSTYKGLSLIGRLLLNQKLSNEDKVKMAEWLEQRWVRPTRDERATIELLKPAQWQAGPAELRGR